MGKNEKTLITVNEKEYYVEDFNDQQRVLLNHVNDLDRKLSSARFNVDQLAVGRERFIELLDEALQQETVTDADYDEVPDQED
jgi:hypothetical protein